MAERRFDSFYIPSDVKFREGITYTVVASDFVECGVCTTGECGTDVCCKDCIFSSLNNIDRALYWKSLQKEENMKDEPYTMYKGLKVPCNKRFRDDCNAVNAAAPIFDCSNVAESIDINKPGCPCVSCSECIYSRHNAEARGEYCKFIGHNVNKMPDLRTGMVVKIKDQEGTHYGLVVNNVIMYFECDEVTRTVNILEYDMINDLICRKDEYEFLAVWNTSKELHEVTRPVLNKCMFKKIIEGEEKPIWTKPEAVELTVGAIEEKLRACNVLREGETIKIVKEE